MDASERRDYIDILRQGIHLELEANARYNVQKTERSIIDGVDCIKTFYKCSHPFCRCKYVVMERGDDHYICQIDQHETPHENSTQRTYSSSFLRSYLKLYFENGGDEANSLHHAFDVLKIPYDFTQTFFALNQEALHRNYKRVAAANLNRLAESPTLSSEIFLTRWKRHFPQDLTYFDVEECTNDLHFIYSDYELTELARASEIFHIDSTFKLIFGGLPLYAITVKSAQNHIIPVCYFIINRDTSENIKFCMQKFFEYLGIDPPAFMSDAGPNILSAIQELFPNSKFFICILHVIRAIQRNSDKFEDKSNYARVSEIMWELMNSEYDENGFFEYLGELQCILEIEPTAAKYFDRQWFDYIDNIASISRNPELPKTNNLAEAHFRQLKYFYFGGHRNLRLDTVIQILLENVFPSMKLRAKMDTILNDAKVLNLVKNISDSSYNLYQDDKQSCLEMLEKVKELVINDKVDPKVIENHMKKLI